ncbi:MAG: 30S ribosomal protein S21 [Candidatus Wallbacteria bacterium]|nr:30S ribosomal protein S21 [Candidatus Wallbacteria bacterium]
MAEVKIDKDEPLEKALKRFRKKCEQSGILSEIKKRAYYEKPSEKKKRKAAEAKRKMRKKMLKEKRYQ